MITEEPILTIPIHHIAGPFWVTCKAIHAKGGTYEVIASGSEDYCRGYRDAHMEVHASDTHKIVDARKEIDMVNRKGPAA
jgi:hypothetical protein